MAIQLEPKEKRWLKRVYFYLLKMNKPSANNWDVATFNSAAKGNMQLDSSAKVDDAWDAIQTVNSVIINGDYTDITDAINTLAKDTEYWDKDTDDYLKLSAKEISDALAGMCVVNGLEWHSGDYTKFEIAQFDKTMFGKSLKAAREANNHGSGVTATQTPNQPQPQTPTKPTKPAQSASTPGGVPIAGNYINGKSSVHGRSVQVKYKDVPVDPNDPSKGTMRVKVTPKSDYKHEGPKSPFCRDLKSTPGNKVYLTGEQGYVFVIVAEDNTKSKNLPYLFVSPLKNSAKFKVGNTNRVIMGSAHWYGDLKLFFNTFAEADAFLIKTINANRIDSTRFTNVHIEAKELSKGNDAKFLSHGFYEIGTELGNAYVCAYRLNEDLHEDLDEAEPTAKETTTFDEAKWREDIDRLFKEGPWN